jgi:TDG/mug DNA glycosylase family protein
MRLNVHPFTLKLMEHRPRLVCFVGKKIWDVYESVAGKTATATATGTGMGTTTGTLTLFDPVTPVTPVKLEQANQVLVDLECAPEQANDHNSPIVIKLEPEIVPDNPPSTPSPSRGRRQPVSHPKPHPKPQDKPQRKPMTPKTPQGAKPTFDWTQPRALRLPLPPSESVRGKADANDVDVEPRSHCYFWVVPSTSGLERTPVSLRHTIPAASPIHDARCSLIGALLASSPSPPHCLSQ